MASLPPTMRQLRSLVTHDGELRVSIDTVEVPVPAGHEVVVQVVAAPINPSDIGLLLAKGDLSQAVASNDGGRVVTAPIPAEVLGSLAARAGVSMPVGNEGAGVVVAAGKSPEAQALLGRNVSFFGGSSYAEYVAAPTWMVLALPEGVGHVEGASAFINPLTALGMVETMRREGHTALVHTAAASNLGHMLNRICQADGVELVNIVRSEEQAASLRSAGATHVCDSSLPTFEADLVAALRATGATLAFDAVGGGQLAGQILHAMEVAAVAPDAAYSRYGSDVHKQVYIYGGLDPRPTELRRTFGFAWGLGGWLLTPFLMRSSAEDLQRLSDRIAAEITTTFASRYTEEITLDQVLDLAVMRRFAQQSTGQKFLLKP